ncbi:uncharacterized protein NPIL_203441 [Nephila pilipes]|uniref:Transposase n=1 Tax=Nephila pilipes TaxID=299642 RepID=A0A8X6UGX7_NEPPI|nr:uncharacterized protein NPIL_203441 [Nephila pilipes]
MVLVKLRLGLLREDLAFRFKISKSTANCIFKEWIRRLAEFLEDFIDIPTKKKPFNLDSRAGTFSQYKHHNTVKFLLACSPLGKVTFVSHLFGGRTSDKQIIQLIGFLEKIKPGDVIFADRGFSVKLVAERNATLVLPTSTKGKQQLSSKKIQSSRKMSRLRVHIERSIGRLKNYRILKTTRPISLLHSKSSENTCTGDDMVIVIAALFNVGKGCLIKETS